MNDAEIIDQLEAALPEYRVEVVRLVNEGLVRIELTPRRESLGARVPLSYTIGDSVRALEWRGIVDHIIHEGRAR